MFIKKSIVALGIMGMLLSLAACKTEELSNDKSADSVVASLNGEESSNSVENSDNSEVVSSSDDIDSSSESSSENNDKYTVLGVEVTHQGTLEDPLCVSDALMIAKSLSYNQGKSTSQVYVSGIVSEVDTSGGHFNFYIDEGTSSIYCYGLYNNEDKEYGTADGCFGLDGTPLKNDTVILYSYIQNFYGTYELTQSKLISLVEGEHIAVTETKFNPNNLVWINKADQIVTGRYIIGGYLSIENVYHPGEPDEVTYKKENYFLMSHALSSQLTGTEVNDETTELILEEYTYDVNVTENGISFKNTDSGKYVGYASGTKLKWSSEEVFWALSDATLSNKASIRAIYQGTSRKLQCRYDGKFGAYSEEQCSDLTFSKVQ